MIELLKFDSNTKKIYKIPISTLDLKFYEMTREYEISKVRTKNICQSIVSIQIKRNPKKKKVMNHLRMQSKKWM